MSNTNPTNDEGPTLIQLQNRINVAADQLTSARLERDEAATRSDRMEVQSRVEFLEGVLDAHQRRLQAARRALAFDDMTNEADIRRAGRAAAALA